MRKYYFLSFILVIVSLNSDAQLRNSIWQMGYNGGGAAYQFNFQSGALSIQTVSRPMNFGRTNSGISSEQGDLLFYTNGVYVANAMHDTMLNGSGLNPGSGLIPPITGGLRVPQGTLIVPDVGNQNQYYIFHLVTNVYNNLIADALFYTKVDMSLDGGLGAVTQKNVVLRVDSFDPGELVATKHANGRDWWVISHQHLTNLYIKYLVEPTGISGPYYQNIGVNKYLAGQAVFSEDGLTYASYDNTNGLEVFAFDRCTGVFSKYRHINMLDGLVGAGVSFSPNSRYIYVSSNLYIYQFDLLAANFSNYDTVAVWDGFFSLTSPYATNFFNQVLGPDGRIYINSFNSVHHIHVIAQPDLPGLSCNVQQHSVFLPGYNQTVPNFPNYYLGRQVGSICDTVAPVGIVESQSLADLEVYPNPASQEFTFDLEWGESVKVSIFDVVGKDVSSQVSVTPSLSSVLVKNNKLPNGIYYVEVKSAQRTLVGKVILQQ
ncbi:MAG: T9SS type A sorting domain-containing protein [Bacteroidia bacterium]|nr:T9SS type A sorting domain-containing protein [Bacteroidia bacterium]